MKNKYGWKEFFLTLSTFGVFGMAVWVGVYKQKIDSAETEINELKTSLGKLDDRLRSLEVTSKGLEIQIGVKLQSKSSFEKTIRPTSAETQIPFEGNSFKGGI